MIRVVPLLMEYLNIRCWHPAMLFNTHLHVHVHCTSVYQYYNVHVQCMCVH